MISTPTKTARTKIVISTLSCTADAELVAVEPETMPLASEINDVNWSPAMFVHSVQMWFLRVQFEELGKRFRLELQ